MKGQPTIQDVAASIRLLAESPLRFTDEYDLNVVALPSIDAMWCGATGPQAIRRLWNDSEHDILARMKVVVEAPTTKDRCAVVLEVQEYCAVRALGHGAKMTAVVPPKSYVEFAMGIRAVGVGEVWNVSLLVSP